jgi:hypothetical protein
MGLFIIGYLAIIPSAAWATVCALRASSNRLPIVILLTFVAVGLISTIVQNKGFGYHLGALLPPLFGLAGATLGLVPQMAGWRWLTQAIFLGVALLAVVGLLSQVRSLGPQIRYLAGVESRSEMMQREGAGAGEGLRWSDLLEAADYASKNTAPDDTILVWGRPVSIHMLARRRSPSRFITFGMLVPDDSRFAASSRWHREFSDALMRKAPRLVFVVRELDRLDAGFTAHHSTIERALFTDLAARYEPVRRFGSLNCYRLIRG